MISYKVEFAFNDIDSNLYTSGKGSVVMEVQADDLKTALMIADRVCKVLGADHCVFLD